MKKQRNAHPRSRKKHGVFTVVPLLLIGGLLFVLLYLLVYIGTSPETHDIAIGTPASETIYATKDVKNTYRTDLLRANAEKTVDAIYLPIDSTVQPVVLEKLDESITALQTIAGTYTPDEITAMTDDQFSFIISSLPARFSRAQISAVTGTDADTLTAVTNLTKTAVTNILKNGLKEGSEGDAANQVAQELKAAGYADHLVSALSACVRTSLSANMLIDQEATDAAKEAARATVADVMVVKGEVIVREGEIVTTEQYSLVETLGLLNDNTIDWQSHAGIGTIVLAVFLSLVAYLSAFGRELLLDIKKMLLLSMILAITVGLCLIFSFVNVYMMPVSLALLLISLLIDRRLALFCNYLITILVSLFASGQNSFFSMAMFSVLVMAVVAGPFALLVMGKRIHRTSCIVAGFTVALSNFTVTIAIGLLTSSNFDSVSTSALWAAAGGPVSALIAIGLQPILEVMFSLVTPTKLLELSNPSQPLLRRLQIEAPGTYHHSIIVANLAEAAGDAIGADSLLARVGAFYHDIGKLRRPIYFKENQMGDNPHDRTDPRVSAEILTSHPRDGAIMAQHEHLPTVICQLIQQHHGDSGVMYFYSKAKELYGDDLDPSVFRYPGPRPASREAAILMLADVTEAATRTLQNPSPDSLKAFIRKMIHDRLEDGQLDRSELTLRDLDLICDAFYRVLSGAFHERIEYPEVEPPERTAEAADEKKHRLKKIGGKKHADRS